MKKRMLSLFALTILLSLSACSSTSPPSDQLTFSELTVVDNDACTVKITGIDPENQWGYTLNVYLENKSEDTTYMFSVDGAAVNGVQSDPLFASEVSAGKKSNEEIHFSSKLLRENGITEFTDIELIFRVYDSDDWLADDIVKQAVHVYPYGKEKATVFVREAQPSDNVLVDNRYVTAIVLGYEKEAILGYTVKLFLVNKTDTEVMFTADNAAINGYMADPLFASSVLAGKCAFSSMSWSDTVLEKNGITDVQKIEFSFRAYDSDALADDDLINEKITLSP